MRRAATIGYLVIFAGFLAVAAWAKTHDFYNLAAPLGYVAFAVFVVAFLLSS